MFTVKQFLNSSWIKTIFNRKNISCFAGCVVAVATIVSVRVASRNNDIVEKAAQAQVERSRQSREAEKSKAPLAEEELISWIFK